jgi:MSHA biogenesis protein MshJ
MQIIDSLKPRLAQFDGMSLRQRAGLVAAAVAVLYFVMDLLVLGPDEVRSKALKQSIAKQKTELETTRKMSSVLSGALAHDPNAKQQAQLDAIKRTIVETDALLAQFDSAEPQAAGAVLREVLGATPGLELVSLKMLPVTVAFESKSVAVAPAKPAPTAAPPAPGVKPAAPTPEVAARPPRSIYRHGMEITIKGNYLALLPYLEKLQKYPGRLYWGELSLEVQTYPFWVMKLTVYTLSGQANPRLG